MQDELADIERALGEQNALISKRFAKGEVEAATSGFYCEDVYYLTPDLRLLQGRDQVLGFLRETREQVNEVRLFPLRTWISPTRGGVVYQLVNATMHPIGGAEPIAVHYFAAFRRVGTQWLCEVEVPALGTVQG